jgi:hypothetical protein
MKRVATKPPMLLLALGRIPGVRTRILHSAKNPVGVPFMIIILLENQVLNIQSLHLTSS